MSTSVIVMKFATDYDSWLFDLDGTVWEGGRLLPSAKEVINNASVPVAYITNNASRSPLDVALMLTEVGLTTSEEQVLTSAQAAVEMSLENLCQGDKVFVLGSEAFKALASKAGFVVVDSAEDLPSAVLQGHNPETGWVQLSEAALCIRNGARYFVSNLDTTLPSERGLLVGNGSMVAAVVSATGVTPISAGKPDPTMFFSAAKKLGSQKPLAIGDRLNTDIAGGVAAGMDSLHVLTGVSSHFDVLRATIAERPCYLAESLDSLNGPLDGLRPGAQGGFSAAMDKFGNIVLSGGDSSATAMNAYRTACAVAWQSPEFTGEVIPEGPKAIEALKEWR